MKNTIKENRKEREKGGKKENEKSAFQKTPREREKTGNRSYSQHMNENSV